MSHIFIFGPSCSGKSTLAQRLLRELGGIYLDRDIFIEKGICTDEDADGVLDQKITEIKDRVIVDAQVPWRERREGELYFLVLPPLQTLLERDDRRTAHLQRPAERAHRARQYVIHTHETLSRLSKEFFTQCFDSSQMTLQEEVQQVMLFWAK